MQRQGFLCLNLNVRKSGFSNDSFVRRTMQFLIKTTIKAATTFLHALNLLTFVLDYWMSLITNDIIIETVFTLSQQK